MAKNRPVIMAAIVIAVAVSGFLIWQSTLSDTDAEGFARGNGRIEAVEIDVAAKLPGRIDTVLVNEGGLVTAGAPLATLDTRQLQANRNQMVAELRRAEIAVENATLLVEQRAAEVRAAEALLEQRRAEEDVARRQYERSESLTQKRPFNCLGCNF